MIRTLGALLIGAVVLGASPALAGGAKVIQKRDGTIEVRGDDSGLKVREAANGTLKVRQKGDDARLKVRQKGDTNAVKAKQRGDNVGAKVFQDGTVNNAKLVQKRGRR